MSTYIHIVLCICLHADLQIISGILGIIIDLATTQNFSPFTGADNEEGPPIYHVSHFSNFSNKYKIDFYKLTMGYSPVKGLSSSVGQTRVCGGGGVIWQFKVTPTSAVKTNAVDRLTQLKLYLLFFIHT